MEFDSPILTMFDIAEARRGCAFGFRSIRAIDQLLRAIKGSDSKPSWPNLSSKFPGMSNLPKLCFSQISHIVTELMKIVFP